MSNRSYKTKLKRNVSDIIYPITLADAVYLKNNAGKYGIKLDDKIIAIIESIENIQNDIKKLQEDTKFKGSFGSVEELPKTGNVGDYAIVKHEDKEDEFYIWDVTEEIWVPKGTVINSAVTSVNGQTGDVNLNDKNIYTTDVLPAEKDENGNIIKNEFTLNETLLGLKDYTNEIELEVERVEGIATKYKDNWVETATYSQYDIVNYNNKVYINVSENPLTNVVPGSNENWKIIAVTETYVAENGGKIDKITVNGVEQIIEEKIAKINIDFVTPNDLKAVEDKIPTSTSKLVNDSDFATNSYVDEKFNNIPTPDVSGQIKNHNEDIHAHPYIQSLLPTVIKVEG